MHNYSPPKNLLEDRVILVTGATRGIGRAVAADCARHRATVLLHGRDEKALQSLYEELRELGPEPAVAQLDLERAQGPAYQQLIDEIEKRYGRLDGLVHNAAILGERSPIEYYDIGVWQRVMHINVNAGFILTRCLLPLLRESADASVLFTSSGVGHKGRAYWGAYAVSKFAVEGMTQVLADEMEKTSVRVNCINPGPVRTRMRAQAFPAEDPQTLRTPEELTGAYLYLLGPDSKGVSGQRIDIRS
ncbi:MAG TPA: YciK family oxidoreductase [Gammaproteobacteria bacterium]|nr:YciK family oxidoreductase [Gammaproteobacteria bacterium]